jgi:hypothetical protein
MPDVRDQAVRNDEADVAPPAFRQQRIAEMKCRHWRPRRSRPSLRGDRICIDMVPAPQ